MSKNYPLLAAAPDHLSRAFILYLIENNKVIMEDEWWLVIENCKYHTKERPWLTAFFKGPYRNEQWHRHLSSLYEVYGEWEWLKKATVDQSVKRFHIHLIKRP